MKDPEYLDYFLSKAGIDKMILSIDNKHVGKDMPQTSKDALETLRTTLGVIDYLYSNLEIEYKHNDKLEKQISALAFSNGRLKLEVGKLIIEKDRLLKNVKI